MTTGRINQVSAYHLRPAYSKSAQVTNGIRAKWFEDCKPAPLQEQCTNMWLTLSKAEAKQKDVINPHLDAQTSPGKLAPTLLISPKTICPAGANTQARA